MFAFLMYIEPKFRLGLVSWSSLIPVNIAEAELQFGFISELNKLEAKKPLKARKSLGEAFDLMREFFPVEPSQRQERMQKKFEEFVQERRKRLGGNLKKRRNKTTCPIVNQTNALLKMTDKELVYLFTGSFLTAKGRASSPTPQVHQIFSASQRHCSQEMGFFGNELRINR